MRIASVYCITNIINGKKYIGVSIHPARRMRCHLSGKRDGSLLVGKAVAKYGKDYFKTEILLVGIETYCYEMEVKLIAALNTQSPNGFNIASGGQRPHSEKGRPGTKNGYVTSEETKKKISNSRKGYVPWNKGRVTDEETKKKISNTKKGKSTLKSDTLT